MSGQADGASARINDDLVSVAAELADMVLGMNNMSPRALALAATISGLIGTKAGNPTDYSKYVFAKDLVVGNIYIGHKGTEHFIWDFLGFMPDKELFRLRRTGEESTVERLADHGLSSEGGPKGCWTEYSGLDRNSTKRAMNDIGSLNVEMPYEEPDVFAT